MANQNGREQELLRQLLATEDGKRAAGVVAQIDPKHIRDKIEQVDKEDVIRRMRELNLGAMADKLRSTSTDDIMRALTDNPQVLDKLRQLFK